MKKRRDCKIIKNIVFDLGNVLLRFRPKQYLEERFADPDLQERLFQAVFTSPEWVELDRGTLSEEEAVNLILERNPRLLETREIFSDWEEILKPIEETIDLLPELKDAGYRLYILSNFHLRPFELISDREFFSYFDGKVISSRVKTIKPEEAIYQHLLERFELDPRETVFIDDTEENLRAARRFGITTILLEDPSRLKVQFRALDIL